MEKQENWDSKNKRVKWDRFNGRTYQERWAGGRLEEEDRWAMLLLAQKLWGRVAVNSIGQAADIGTASMLALPLTMAPYATHIDLIDPGRQNIDYLRTTLTSRQKMESDWGPTVQYLQEFDSTVYGNVIDDLMERAEIHHAFAQDVLQEQSYDGLTMGFCAGSNSDNSNETARFMDIVLNAVKPGSIYAATHTLNSEPYPDWSTEHGVVNMAKFPSLKVGRGWYADRYAGTGIELQQSPMTEMRPGYEGTLLALGFTATKRLHLA